MNDLEYLLNSRFSEIGELMDKMAKDDKEKMTYSPTSPTLKAALFLMLYNMIESVVYCLFENLFDEIQANCSSFSQLNESIQKQYKKYDKESCIPENDLLSLDLSKYSGKITLFSGNLDARSIRTLLKNWGISADFHVAREEKLHYVRNYRNELAHGERAFKEVGQGYSMREMVKYGEAVHDYLFMLIQVYNNFMSNKLYISGVK